jgi:hypothetical protein
MSSHKGYNTAMRILAASFIALSFLFLASCEMASTPEMRKVIELKDIVNKGDEEALKKILIDAKLEDGTQIISTLYKDEFIGPLTEISGDTLKSILNSINLSNPKNLEISASSSKTLVSDNNNFISTYTPTNIRITDKVSGKSISITVWKKVLQIKKNLRNIKQAQIDFSAANGDFRDPQRMNELFEPQTYYLIGNIVVHE